MSKLMINSVLWRYSGGTIQKRPKREFKFINLHIPPFVLKKKKVKTKNMVFSWTYN